MSELSPVGGVHDDSANQSASHDAHHDRFERRRWVAPGLSPHSTLTVLTQLPLRQPLSLLFLQSSRQCFDQNGNPTPCPP